MSPRPAAELPRLLELDFGSVGRTSLGSWEVGKGSE
jgi:hypothetical protein